MAGWIAFADGYGIDRTQVVDVDNWTLAELERMVQAYLRYLQNPHAYPPGSSDPYDTRTDAQAFSQYMLRTYLPTSGPAIDSVEKLLEVCSEEEYLRLLADRGMDVGRYVRSSRSARRLAAASRGLSAASRTGVVPRSGRIRGAAAGVEVFLQLVGGNTIAHRMDEKSRFLIHGFLTLHGKTMVLFTSVLG